MAENGSIGGIVTHLDTCNASLESAASTLTNAGNQVDEFLVACLNLEMIGTAERAVQLSDAVTALHQRLQQIGHKAVEVSAHASTLGGHARAGSAVAAQAPRVEQFRRARPSAASTPTDAEKPQRREFKKPVRGSGKEKSTGAPSWVKRHLEGKPYAGENGNAFARRMRNDQYGVGEWDDSPRGRAPGTEYGKTKKYGERAFE